MKALLGLLVIGSWLFYPFETYAQTLSGIVFDVANQQPVPNVSIYNPKQQTFVVSDDQGVFQWELLSGPDTLIFSHVSYEDQIAMVGEASNNLRILLHAKDYQLPGIIVSGSANSQPLLEVPGAISLISKQELQRDNQTNVSDPLNRIPGLFMHSGTLSTNRITIRGIGSRSLFSTTKIRAYLNDIPLTSGEGETTIEDIDLSLVDRIEVIKGPASSVYGAGLGGTINMKAAKASYESVSLSNALTLGSYGLLRNVSTLDIGQDKINLKLNYNTTHLDGYRDNSEYDRNSINLLAQAYPGKKNSLTFLGSFIDLLGFIPSSLDSASFGEDPTQAAFTWGSTRGFEDYHKGLLGINYQQTVTQHWDISSSIFGNFREAYELRPFNILVESTSAVGVRFKSNYEIKEGKLYWIGGVEYFREHYTWQTLVNEDRVAGDLISDNDEVRKYYNIFSELNWSPFERTLISFGINFNNTRYDYQDLMLNDGNDLSGQYKFDNQWSPRLAVNHKFNDIQSVYAQISHGFAPPSLSETLTPDGAINPEIQPETGYNFEIGTRGQLKESGWWWDVSIYSMRIQNLLVARRTDNDIFVGVNAGKTRHNGLDVSLNYDFQWTNADLHLWSTYGLAAYTFKEFVDEDDNFSGNELTGTPKHKLSAGLDLSHKQGWYGNLNFLVVSKMPLTDSNSLYSDSYSLTNFKLGYQTNVVNKLGVKVWVAVNNLWDTKYASMLLVNASSFGGRAPRYFYPGLPRNYYTGFSVSWKLK